MSFANQCILLLAMLNRLRNIIGRNAKLKLLEKQQRYYTALLHHNLPETLNFDDADLNKVKEMIRKEYSLDVIHDEIHRNDIMFHYHLLQVDGKMIPALYSHFAVGLRFVIALKECLAEIGKMPQSILDFGSGYGRVSRFLPQVWPEADITVSEVKTEAMQFQKQFGFSTINHGQGVESFEADYYDLILALSVFSHLPQASFSSWLSTLLNHLKPGGILIFSFNKLQKSVGASEGFKYLPNSEDLHFPHIRDAHLDTGDYGHAFLTEERIRKEVDESRFELQFLGNRLTPQQDAAFIRNKA